MFSCDRLVQPRVSFPHESPRNRRLPRGVLQSPAKSPIYQAGIISTLPSAILSSARIQRSAVSPKPFTR